MLNTVACAAPPPSLAAPRRAAGAAARAGWRALAGRAATPGCPRWAPGPLRAAPPAVGGGLRATASSRLRSSGFNTAAVSLSADRPALADDAEDAPHNRVEPEEYRAQLAREEEAGLFEDNDGEEERVEVDATAGPDDSLAVRPPQGSRSLQVSAIDCECVKCDSTPRDAPAAR